MIAIESGRILTPMDTIEHGVILVDGGRIVAVGTADEVMLSPDAQVVAA